MSNARELAQIPSTPSGRRNLIINGDFRVSQRGDYTSATNFVHNTYMLDRWKISTGVTSTIQDLGGYIKLLATASATSSMRIFQLIEDLYLLEGKTVAISCEMKTNSSNGRLQINNGSWVSTNAVHSGSGQWEKLYFTTTLPSSLVATSVQVGIDGVSSADVPISSGDYCEIKNVQLEVGTVATEFEHRSYGEELALCKRYYQLVAAYNVSGKPQRRWQGNICNIFSTTRAFINFPFDVEFRNYPTVTVNNQGFNIAWNNSSRTLTNQPSNIYPNLLSVGIDLDNSGTNFVVGYGAHVDIHSGCYIEADAEL